MPRIQPTRSQFVNWIFFGAIARDVAANNKKVMGK